MKKVIRRVKRLLKKAVKKVWRVIKASILGCLKKGSRTILKNKPHSGFFRVAIPLSFKLYHRIRRNYSKTKKKIIKAMQTNMEETRFEDPKVFKRIYNDIIFCRIVYRIAADEYFVFSFENLSHEGRCMVISRKNKYSYLNLVNHKAYMPYFNIKTETYKKFGKFYQREVLGLYSADDFDRFVDFVGRHPRFIYKPVSDYGGHGIKIYDATQYKSKENLFKILVFGGPCVIEELIKQSDALSRLHPESVNTVRVVSYMSPNGSIRILWTFLRMGMGSSHTDNASSGGLSAMIDPETGIIYATGRDWQGKDVIFHPDSHVQLVGLQLPDWEGLKELLAEVSKVIPQVRMVGWDFAHTDAGWIFIEGNSRPQCVSAQISKFNGCEHLYQEMRADYLRYSVEERSGVYNA